MDKKEIEKKVLELEKTIKDLKQDNNKFDAEYLTLRGAYTELKKERNQYKNKAEDNQKIINALGKQIKEQKTTQTTKFNFHEKVVVIKNDEIIWAQIIEIQIGKTAIRYVFDHYGVPFTRVENAVYRDEQEFAEYCVVLGGE